jgi:hypothetical protein
LTKIRSWRSELILLAGILAWAGCGKDDDIVSLGDESTTNSFSIMVEAPPCHQDLWGMPVCTPLPDAFVRIEFRDQDHTDPHDGGFLRVEEAEGTTNLQGSWSCRVTYVETDSYAADIVLIWVDHPDFSASYTNQMLDENGAASTVVRLAEKRVYQK